MQYDENGQVENIVRRLNHEDDEEEEAGYFKPISL
jgi:hypothetical protein